MTIAFRIIFALLALLIFSLIALWTCSLIVWFSMIRYFKKGLIDTLEHFESTLSDAKEKINK